MEEAARIIAHDYSPAPTPDDEARAQELCAHTTEDHVIYARIGKPGPDCACAPILAALAAARADGVKAAHAAGRASLAEAVIEISTTRGRSSAEKCADITSLAVTEVLPDAG